MVNERVECEKSFLGNGHRSKDPRVRDPRDGGAGAES